MVNVGTLMIYGVYLLSATRSGITVAPYNTIGPQRISSARPSSSSSMWLGLD